MKFARFSNRDGRPTVGLVQGEYVIDLTRVATAYRRRVEGSREPVPTTMLEWIEGRMLTQSAMSRFTRFAAETRSLKGAWCPIEEVRLLAPIRRPPKVLALGLNYAAHAAESGKEPPDHPIVFAKAPTCIIGPGESIVIKPWLGRVDPEVELAVVIGRGGADIPPEKAMRHVLGYTVFNDVTARAMQREDLERSHPWLRSKSIDTFGPMGPWIVSRDEIADPHALDLELRVNGQVRQRASTSRMTFRIPEIIAFISRHLRLEAGDVIATGTPEGIAPIVPGDVLECSISGIGTLRNRVILGRN